MENLANVLSRLSFGQMLWLFVGVFMIHELEEWNIADFERRHFVGLPEWHTPLNARMWILVICAVATVWCALATMPGNPGIAAYVFLPALLLAAGNAVQHLIWTLRFRQYAPGLGTGALLVLPLSIYAVLRALGRHHVSLLYVGALVAVVALVLVRTVTEGNNAPKMVNVIYRAGDRLAHLLGLGKGETG
jgi:hypothetical protein